MLAIAFFTLRVNLEQRLDAAAVKFHVSERIQAEQVDTASGGRAELLGGGQRGCFAVTAVNDGGVHVAAVVLGMVARTVPLWAVLGVITSAGGSQGGDHFLGYPLHVSCSAGAAGKEVESGEAEAQEAT